MDTAPQSLFLNSAMTPQSRFLNSAEMVLWDGEEGRAIVACEACTCGCDSRDGFKGKGYITGSTPDGKGFTLWVNDPGLWERIKAVFQAQGLVRPEGPPITLEEEVEEVGDKGQGSNP